MNEQSEKLTSTDLGTIKIANDVVAIIAGLAATEVNGVVGMSGGIVGGIAELVGRKNLSKGVKVEVGVKETAVDIYAIVEFGSSIPEVATKIQQSVKDAVESMTGLKVVEVNVHIQGVVFPKEIDSEIEPRVR
ncbi:MAG: Asp23/Gls24 family envelope stress response protein [Bacillota bacterium]|nr:Asp23/Gls24 family envelope stress response protein [Bacillota bacterium]